MTDELGSMGQVLSLLIGVFFALLLIFYYYLVGKIRIYFLRRILGDYIYFSIVPISILLVAQFWLLDLFSLNNQIEKETSFVTFLFVIISGFIAYRIMNILRGKNHKVGNITNGKKKRKKKSERK